MVRPHTQGAINIRRCCLGTREAHPYFRADIPDHFKRPRIHPDDEDVVEKAAFLNALRQLFFDQSGILDFEKIVNPVTTETKKLLQSRNSLSRELGAKPATRVEIPEFVQREVVNRAAAIGSAVDQLVVQ